MKHLFIYSLVDEKGHIFYIGKCANTYRRYIGHLYRNKECPTGKFITNMMNNGFYPILNILFYLPMPEASAMERHLIHALQFSGHCLTNSQLNARYYPGDVTPTMQTCDRSTAINKAKNDYLTHYSNK